MIWLPEETRPKEPAMPDDDTQVDPVVELQRERERRRQQRTQPPPNPSANSSPNPAEAPIPLGYSKDGRFVLLDVLRNLVVCYSANQLTTVSCLMALAPSGHWVAQFPPGRRSDAPFNATEAGDQLMQECRRAGPIDPADIRGRGIWLEDDKIVINLGDPVTARGKYVCFAPIKIDPSATFNVKRLLRLLELFQWRNKKDGTLVLGWLAVAPICGVLSWRPHIWIHGPTQTGKTTLHELLKSTSSPLALSCDGGSTEAGIRQTLGPDSLPVIVDEFESDQAHIRGVLRLARSASSATDPVLRGTVDGRAMVFILRTMFAFLSVNPCGMEAADESRIVLLELCRHDNSTKTAKKIIAEIAFFRQQEGKWCSMMVSRAHLVPPAVAEFERVIASGNRRYRQNMATFLAGAFVACTTPYQPRLKLRGGPRTSHQRSRCMPRNSTATKGANVWSSCSRTRPRPPSEHTRSDIGSHARPRDATIRRRAARSRPSICGSVRKTPQTKRRVACTSATGHPLSIEFS